VRLPVSEALFLTLNDEFGGSVLVVPGAWTSGQSKTLDLSDFVGRFNHQRFKPDYDRVSKVTIKVGGYQLGIYETR
jgi:hypothetical protein